MKKYLYVLVIFILISIIGIVKVIDYNQSEVKILEKEIDDLMLAINSKKIPEMDLLSIYFDRTMTKGSYKVIEEGTKKYIYDIVDNNLKLKDKVDIDEIKGLVTTDNIAKDAPEYKNSIKYLNNLLEEFKNTTDRNLELASKDKIFEYIDMKKINTFIRKEAKNRISSYTSNLNKISELNTLYEDSTSKLSNLRDTFSYLANNKELYGTLGVLINSNEGLKNIVDTILRDLVIIED